MACNKRRIVNAGDPFGSCSSRTIIHDILILRHKLGNQETDLCSRLKLVETLEKGRSAEPRQKEQQPKTSGESDHLILL